MSTTAQTTKKLDLDAFFYPGGISISAKNVMRNGDYAKVCFLLNVKAFADGSVLDVVGNMGEGFKNSSAINQVKQFVLSINNTLRFTDEPKAPIIEPKDVELYTKEQLKTAMLRVDSYKETPTEFDRKVMSWAEQKGFIISQSYTQKYYTNLGRTWVTT